MSEKLEQVARAIRQSDIDNGHANEGTDLTSYFAPSRAAVEAIREHTDAMCDVGNSILDYPNTGTHSASLWRAMIDEILK